MYRIYIYNLVNPTKNPLKQEIEQPKMIYIYLLDLISLPVSENHQHSQSPSCYRGCISL